MPNFYPGTSVPRRSTTSGRRVSRTTRLRPGTSTPVPTYRTRSATPTRRKAKKKVPTYQGGIKGGQRTSSTPTFAETGLHFYPGTSVPKWGQTDRPSVGPPPPEMLAHFADPAQGNVHAYASASAGSYAGSGGGVSSGGEAATIADLHDIKFQEYDANLQGGNPPSWWRPLVPANAKDMERPDVAYLAMLNAAIPYLSPEDQRNAAAQLYSAHANAFAIYKQAKINEQAQPTQSITHEQALLSEEYKKDPSRYSVIDRDYFTSQARATGFIDALNQMRQNVGAATGKFPRKHIGGTGQGYSWLEQIAGVQQNYGGRGLGEGQTRAQYLAQMGGLDPLFALGQSQDIGPVAAIGQMFAKPFFSAGAITPKYQTAEGQTFFGGPNRLLF